MSACGLKRTNLFPKQIGNLQRRYLFYFILNLIFSNFETMQLDSIPFYLSFPPLSANKKQSSHPLIRDRIYFSEWCLIIKGLRLFQNDNPELCFFSFKMFEGTNEVKMPIFKFIHHIFITFEVLKHYLELNLLVWSLKI